MVTGHIAERKSQMPIRSTIKWLLILMITHIKYLYIIKYKSKYYFFNSF